MFLASHPLTERSFPKTTCWHSNCIFSFPCRKGFFLTCLGFLFSIFRGGGLLRRFLDDFLAEGNFFTWRWSRFFLGPIKRSTLALGIEGAKSNKPPRWKNFLLRTVFFGVENSEDMESFFFEWLCLVVVGIQVAGLGCGREQVGLKFGRRCFCCYRSCLGDWIDSQSNFNRLTKSRFFCEKNTTICAGRIFLFQIGYFRRLAFCGRQISKNQLVFWSLNRVFEFRPRQPPNSAIYLAYERERFAPEEGD